MTYISTSSGVSFSELRTAYNQSQGTSTFASESRVVFSDYKRNNSLVPSYGENRAITPVQQSGGLLRLGQFGGAKAGSFVYRDLLRTWNTNGYGHRNAYNTWMNPIVVKDVHAGTTATWVHLVRGGFLSSGGGITTASIFGIYDAGTTVTNDDNPGSPGNLYDVHISSGWGVALDAATINTGTLSVICFNGLGIAYKTNAGNAYLGMQSWSTSSSVITIGSSWDSLAGYKYVPLAAFNNTHIFATRHYLPGVTGLNPPGTPNTTILYTSNGTSWTSYLVNVFPWNGLSSNAYAICSIKYYWGKLWLIVNGFTGSYNSATVFVSSNPVAGGAGSWTRMTSIENALNSPGTSANRDIDDIVSNGSSWLVFARHGSSGNLVLRSTTGNDDFVNIASTSTTGVPWGYAPFPKAVGNLNQGWFVIDNNHSSYWSPEGVNWYKDLGTRNVYRQLISPSSGSTADPVAWWYGRYYDEWYIFYNGGHYARTQGQDLLLDIDTTGTNWKLETRLLSGLAGPTAMNYGRSISIANGYPYTSGSYGYMRVAVGAFGDDSFATDAGAVYVYQKNNYGWTLEQKVSASDITSYYYLGMSVKLNSTGTYLFAGAAGAVGGGSNSGAVYVYTRSAQTWTQSAKISTSTYNSGMDFGRNISINSNADIIAISAPFETIGGIIERGAVYIYQRTGSTWNFSQRLQSPTTTSQQLFGQSVALSADSGILAIASSGIGSLWFTVRSGNTYGTIQTIIQNAGGSLGRSLDISADGGIIVAGSPSASSNNGEVRIYYKDVTTTNYRNYTTLTHPDSEVGSEFGFSVKLDNYGNTLVVGAPHGDDPESARGEVFVYRRTGFTWTLLTRLQDPLGDAADYLGIGVTIDSFGSTIAAGASEYDNPNITGSVLLYTRPLGARFWDDPLGPPLAQIQLSSTVTYLNQSFDIFNLTQKPASVLSYAWDYTNDGIVDYYGPNTTTSFATAGNYTIKMTAVSPYGISTSTASITVVAPPFTATISTNVSNLDVRAYALANGWSGVSTATFNINNNVEIYSTTTSLAALIISGSFPNGITINNAGAIWGKGGRGGNADQNGFDGGDAVHITTTGVSFNNTGYIGGGGGGGAGGVNNPSYYQPNTDMNRGGGGGGAGGGNGGTGDGLTTAGTGFEQGKGNDASGYDGPVNFNSTNYYWGAGAGGGNGQYLSGPYTYDGDGGSASVGWIARGGWLQGGGGGAGYNKDAANPSVYLQGTGGNGGPQNVAGGTGANGAGGGGGGYGQAGGSTTYKTAGGATVTLRSGGAAGNAVNSFGNTVTWIANGTRYGSVVVNPPTFSVTYVIVGGGGGGGGADESIYIGAGGGGGGYLSGSLTLQTGNSYSVTIGAGGLRASGSPSSFHSFTAQGGGEGSGKYGPAESGGSGGGAATPQDSVGAAGTALQGNKGGDAGGYYGGGGGSSQAGFPGSSSAAGNGGNGTASSITGSSVYRAGGGGGGGNYNQFPAYPAGTSGLGGGFYSDANSGGGGEGADQPASGSTDGVSGNSGVVIVSYPSSYTISLGLGLTGSTNTVGSNKVTVITAGSGNISWS